MSVNCADNAQEDPETQAPRYKPEGLDALVQTTKFSRKELQILYRGFKQVVGGFRSVCIGLSETFAVRFFGSRPEQVPFKGMEFALAPSQRIGLQMSLIGFCVSLIVGI